MKNSATDSLASISSVSNSRFALSYSTSSDAFAIFVRARQASEIDPIRITIFNNSSSFSKALVSDCQAFSEMSTSLGSCTLSNSARGVPEVPTIISESSAESQPLIEAHVRKRCKKVGKFQRGVRRHCGEGAQQKLQVRYSRSIDYPASGLLFYLGLFRCYSISRNEDSNYTAVALVQQCTFFEFLALQLHCI